MEKKGGDEYSEGEIGAFSLELGEREGMTFNHVRNLKGYCFLYSADRPFVIYYDARKEPVKPKMIIEVPSPFPYKDNKAVPWKYDVNIVTPEDEKSKAVTENVGEVGHFTHSGRCYSKEVEPVKKNSDLK
ncbi:hypothetical protein GOBAR_AA26797 [Gossypium barbadense]|uniref:Uncharacterized protein n=1 Tax=Gossypium barbadense TaxID=3634 RepID=A0A2P5WS18_GOSBA|nr:hypothetical protein GOBAR_AA26797 [Gossypium barbadense]